MFQNIEELEKQVKEFQKNILASSEFIKGVQNLTSMVESQQTQFDKDSKDMLSAIETYTKYVKEQTDLLIKSLTEQTSKEADDFAKSNNELIAKVKASSEELTKFVTEQVTLKAKEVTDANADLIKGFESRFVEYEKSLGLLFDRVKADNVKISEDAVDAFRTINQEYGKKLDDESALLKDLISKLEVKYNDFIQKLENTNVDRLFVELQEMKKSINSKFILLFAGISVAIILTIVSFFIK